MSVPHLGSLAGLLGSYAQLKRSFYIWFFQLPIAEGVVSASREVGLPVPVVVRLEGTNVELGKEILAKSGLPLITADGMWDAAQKVVAATKGHA